MTAEADLAQGHYADAGIDAAFQAVPGGDDVADDLGVGGKQAEAAASDSEAMKTYSTLTEGWGFTPGEAFSLMSDHEVDVVLHNLTNIDNPDEIAAAGKSLAGKAASTAKTAARVGAPVAFAVDSGEGQAQASAQAKAAQILHPQPATCP
jgi:citrate lyase alpha subunit